MFLDYQFYVIAIAIIAAAFFVSRSTRINSVQNIAKDAGDLVVVRSVPLSRLTTLFSHSVIKKDVARIQIAPHCVTLFTHSDNAIDIWLKAHQVEAVAEHLSILLPDAQQVVVS